MRGPTLIGPLFLALLCAAAILAGLAFADTTVKASTPTEPDYSYANLGGLEYHEMLGRPIDPASPVDRQIIRGLAARDRRPARSEELFGAFIAVANDASRPLRTADDIVLRDTDGHIYRPLALPRSNPYAYFPSLLAPRAQLPAQGSPADDNLAATGRLLLFRVPTWRVNEDALELVMHDAQRSNLTASVVV